MYISMYSTAHRCREQTSSRSPGTDTNMVNMCLIRQLTGLLSTTCVLTVPAFCPDGWRVWFGTAICWCCDASDPHVISLKDAMPSNDTLFADTCYHAKKWKFESVRTTYWRHTCENDVLFWPQKRSVATSASIIDSAFDYHFANIPNACSVSKN